MEPISGFVRAVVSDVAFIFGKGMVNAYLLARRTGLSRPQLDLLVRSPGQFVQPGYYHVSAVVFDEHGGRVRSTADPAGAVRRGGSAAPPGANRTGTRLRPDPGPS